MIDTNPLTIFSILISKAATCRRVPQKDVGCFGGFSPKTLNEASAAKKIIDSPQKVLAASVRLFAALSDTPLWKSHLKISKGSLLDFKLEFLNQRGGGDWKKPAKGDFFSRDINPKSPTTERNFWADPATAFKRQCEALHPSLLIVASFSKPRSQAGLEIHMRKLHDRHY